MELRSPDQSQELHICDQCKMELYSIDHDKKPPWNERWNVINIYHPKDADGNVLEICPRCETMGMIERDKTVAELGLDWGYKA